MINYVSQENTESKNQESEHEYYNSNLEPPKDNPESTSMSNYNYSFPNQTQENESQITNSTVNYTEENQPYYSEEHDMNQQPELEEGKEEERIESANELPSNEFTYQTLENQSHTHTVDLSENFNDYNNDSTHNSLVDSDSVQQQDAESLKEKSSLSGHKRSLEDEGVQTENGDGSQTPKWPGWPGDNVFRLLIPLHSVGAIIGRKGQLVRKLCDETRSRIKILDGVPGTDERIVLISGKEDPDALFSPAMEGFLKVHRRIVEGSEADGGSARSHSGVNISAKMLLPATQAGNLIGKQGSTIKTIQDSSGASIRILPIEDLPLCALDDDRLVDVTGSSASVEHALQLILQHLRRFLVDRSALILFEQTRAYSRQRAVATAGLSYSQSLPPSQSSMYNRSHSRSSAYSDQYADPYADPFYEPYADTYAQPSDAYPSSQHLSEHREHSTYDLPKQTSSVSNLPSVVSVTQVVTMQVPLSYADAIIGAGGANIMYLRSTSGATVTIQESRSSSGVPDMTIEIRGTASQVETAQLLLQSFMTNQNGTPTKSSGAEYGSQRNAPSNGYADSTYASTEGTYPQSYGY